MRKALAVAELDLRRRWLAAGAFAVAAGLIPALARYIPERVEPTDAASFALGVAALIAGATFGSDFTEGKSSFFFARPISTPSIVAGRIAALCGLCAVAVLGFTASYWVSGRQSLVASLVPITTRHLQIVTGVWIASLFFALAIATNARQARRREFVELLTGGARVAVAVAMTALMIALFVDLVMRAYATRTPVNLLVWSYAAAAFLSSLAAIEMGRTDRLRIGRVLNVGMYCHTALACVVVLIAWTYVLHPGPGAITGLTYALTAPDGRVAYVFTHVDRGDSPMFVPAFSVDLGSGEAKRVTADGGFSGRESPRIWHSRDGGIRVWNEQTPLLFRFGRRVFTSASTFRFRSSFGDATPFELPEGADFDWNDLEFRPIDILPASAGDLFAVRWRERTTGEHVAFVSPSRGELSRLTLPTPQSISAWAFVESGRLRVVVQHAGNGELQFIDIDTATGSTRTVLALGGRAAFYRSVILDASAHRALLFSAPYPSGPSDATVALLQLDAPQPTAVTLSTSKTYDPEASFLADGRIAVLVRQPPTADLRLFSPEGALAFTRPLGEGFTTLGGEPFANVLWVSTLVRGISNVALIDARSGESLRRIRGFRTLANWDRELPPPPGSPGAHLLMSTDSKLYLLPSVTEDPRPLILH